MQIAKVRNMKYELRLYKDAIFFLILLRKLYFENLQKVVNKKCFSKVIFCDNKIISKNCIAM